VVVGGYNNRVSTNCSAIVGGYSNIIFSGSDCSFIGGGYLNQILDTSVKSVIGGGYSNAIGRNSVYSVIAGGYNNSIDNSDYSAILGGGINNTNACDRVMIVGNNITANRSLTTFVNNLSIMNIPASGAGLPTGAVYSYGGTLRIVP